MTLLLGTGVRVNTAIMEKIAEEIEDIQAKMRDLEENGPPGASLPLKSGYMAPLNASDLLSAGFGGKTPVNRPVPRQNTDNVPTFGRDDSPQGGARSKVFYSRGMTPGSHLVTNTKQVSNLSRPTLDKDTSELQNFLEQNKLNTDTFEKLLHNGVDCVEVLQSLIPEDLITLRLSLGQRRKLESILFGSSIGPSGDGESQGNQTKQTGGGHQLGNLGAATQIPALSERDQASDAPGGLDSDIFVGMGIHGSQKPYYDIVDYLPNRSPYDINNDRTALILQREDGVLYADPGMGKEKSLDKISWQQWSEANTHTMARLLADGVPAGVYMKYTIMIIQLAQKYEWTSVLKFDREYRKKQANTGKQWGEDMAVLRDVTLVPKGQGYKNHGANQASNPTGGKSSKNSRNKGRQGQNQNRSQRPPPKPEYHDKYKICRYFNEGECRFTNCKFSHTCAGCGAHSHGESMCQGK